MDTHEQEDRDYEAGCGSELENAYALSQIERPRRNDQAKIDALVAQGRFVVFTSTAVYCPRTDALMGCETLLVSDHATRKEADEAAEAQGESCEDFMVGIAGPAAPEAVEALFEGDEIPF
jgi:hypothetical protein